MDNKGHLHQITGPQLLKQIRLAAAAIGKDISGFSPTDIGLHSARSGAAMAIYLSGIPVYTIMLLGWWSSDAFLRYIQKQVKEFSKGISRKVLKKDKFFTIPTTSTDDPRSRGHTLNIASQNNNSLCFNVASGSLLRVMCWQKNTHSWSNSPINKQITTMACYFLYRFLSSECLTPFFIIRVWI